VSAVPGTPQITSQDRLGMTLFVAIAVHVIVILGVGFKFQLDRQTPQSQQKLDITLVSKRSDTAPDDAQQLAQANLDGDGNVTEKARPTAPAPHNDPLPDPGPDQQTAQPSMPSPTPAPQPVQTLARPTPNAPATAPPIPDTPAAQPLSAELIVERSRAMAGIDAEQGETLKVHTPLLRKKQVTARTREYAYASYLDSWRRKVERVGNLNYPDEAKRRHLSGTLMLQVDLNTNGTLREVIVLRSSGQKLLDDAAIRIVRLAAPYDPFNAAMRKETDILQIIRTWQFLTENRLVSQ